VVTTSVQLAQGGDAEGRGDFTEAVAAYTAALQDPDPHVVAEAHFRLGRAAWRQARYDDAIRLYERAIALAAQLGDPLIQASALNGIGAVHCERGEYAQARARYQAALDLAGDSPLRGKILLNLGVILNIEGDWPAALDLYRRAADTFAGVGDEVSQALALHNMGMVHADGRQWDEADRAFASCLEICDRHGDRQTAANVLLNRTELLVGRERLEEALSSSERALELFTQLGDEVGRAEALRWIGRVHAERGDLPAAERRLRETVRIAMRLQRPLLEAEACRDLGRLKRTEGDREESLKWLRRAHDRFVAVGAVKDAAGVWRELGGEGRG
jgi:tetratricopeptide (TPR) repeat protein